MLLILFIILFFIFIFASKQCEKLGTMESVCETIAIVFAITTIISFFIIVLNHATINGTIASKNQQYDLILCQINNNDLGLKETINQINEWNTDLAFMKALQHDLWLGIYIPNIYDQFEFIDLNKLNL